MNFLRFGIRDLLWAMVVVGLAVGWWRDYRSLRDVRLWWQDHVVRYHSSNPVHYKRLLEWEWPPHYIDE